MVRVNLHTDGGEFYISGSSDEYVGYYNVDRNDNVYTQRSFSAESVLLRTIPTDIFVYNAASEFILPEPIEIFVPAPASVDYKRGWFMRYFVRQTNDINARYNEVDESQYKKVSDGKNPFFTHVQLRWKISGPKFDATDRTTGEVVEPGVYNTNVRTMEHLEKKHNGLKNRLKNLVEFWSGQREAYFPPKLTEINDTLTLPIKNIMPIKTT
jgi:hypothetical protein